MRQGLDDLASFSCIGFSSNPTLQQTQGNILELRARDGARGGRHEVGAARRLGERHDVADGAGAGKQHAHAVETQRKAAHGGRTKLERLKHKANWDSARSSVKPSS